MPVGWSAMSPQKKQWPGLHAGQMREWLWRQLALPEQSDLAEQNMIDPQAWAAGGKSSDTASRGEWSEAAVQNGTELFEAEVAARSWFARFTSLT